VLALVEDLRSHCIGCSPGVANNLLRLATKAFCRTGFQDYSAALWVLFQRREIDIGSVALRMLRTATKTASVGSVDTEMQPIACYFNALLHGLNRAFYATTCGAQLGIPPLPVAAQTGNVCQ